MIPKAKLAAQMLRLACLFIVIQVAFGSAHLAMAQKFVVAPFNFNIQNGFYTSASTNPEALAATMQEVPPQTMMEKSHPDMAMLFPQPGGIVLFKSKNMRDLSNVAGKLMSPSLVMLDTIFHNQVYRQKTGDGEKYSFDMCYSLTIDGKRYYTDFRPHTFIDFRYPLTYHKQLVMLAAQNMGYDMYADKGYPEHFHIAVFQMQNGGIKMHFMSKELPFHYGGEFFDDDGIIKTQYNTDKQTLRIEISGLNETYQGLWDGKDLRHLK